MSLFALGSATTIENSDRYPRQGEWGGACRCQRARSCPEWYLRGLLAQSQLNPGGEIVRMHAYIHVLEPTPADDPELTDNSASIQVLRELPSRMSRFSFDGRVIEGKGYPILT